MPRPHPAPVLRAIRPAFALAVLLLAGCETPRQQAAIAQALSDAADQIDGLRSDVLNLQTTLDSLRVVIAYQDTMITRLANLNHLPVVRPPQLVPVPTP